MGFFEEAGQVLDPTQAASDETEALLRQTGSPAATLSDVVDLYTGGEPPVTDESDSAVTPVTGRQDIIDPTTGESVDPYDAGPSIPDVGFELKAAATLIAVALGAVAIGQLFNINVSA